MIETIKEMYNRNISGPMIAQRLNLPVRKLYKLMDKHGLERRNAKENSQIRFADKPLSYKLKTDLTPSEEKLKIAGAMLYWAEGSRYRPEKSTYNVEFTNSDPEMVKVFLDFLRQICGIDEKKLRGYLYYYDGQNVEELKRFWSETTKIPVEQFTKPYFRENTPNIHNKLARGVMHLRYSDVRLLKQIYQWIGEYKQSIN